jgi:hypothetical protein
MPWRQLAPPVCISTISATLAIPSPRQVALAYVT